MSYSRENQQSQPLYGNGNESAILHENVKFKMQQQPGIVALQNAKDIYQKMGTQIGQKRFRMINRRIKTMECVKLYFPVQLNPFAN